MLNVYSLCECLQLGESGHPLDREADLRIVGRQRDGCYRPSGWKRT